MPVSTQDVAPLVSWEASQRAGCRGWGSKSAMLNNTVYAYSIILRARRENLFQRSGIQHGLAPLGKLFRAGFGEAFLDSWRQCPKAPMQLALKQVNRSLAPSFLPPFLPPFLLPLP